MEKLAAAMDKWPPDLKADFNSSLSVTVILSIKLCI